MICTEQHRYIPVLNGLPDDQSGDGRHKCAGCAYQQGIIDGLNQNPKLLDPERLNDSQAGDGRHKDVQAAYELGYQRGLGLRN